MARVIPINLELLEYAFGNTSPLVSSFLNTTTGYVVRLASSASELRTLERLRNDPEYVVITPVDGRTQYQWIEAFLGTVEDEALRTNLVKTSRGPGMFPRFKAALAHHPAVYAAWLGFQRQRLHHVMDAWLTAHALTRAPEFDDDKVLFGQPSPSADASRSSLVDLGHTLGPREHAALLDLAIFLAQKRPR